MKTAGGPDRPEMAGHPHAGANLRRAENPMSAAGRGSEGRTNSPQPGCEGSGRPVAVHRAKERVGA
jgi:hypothetical protein